MRKKRRSVFESEPKVSSRPRVKPTVMPQFEGVNRAGIRVEDIPEGFGLERMGPIEDTCTRRGKRTALLVDPRVSMLDAMHHRSKPEQMETVSRVDACGDAAIEARVQFPAGLVPQKYVRGDFYPVMRRAYTVLERAQVVRIAGRFRGPRYAQSSMEFMAQIVAAYHVLRHTPRDQRTPDWPRGMGDLAQMVGVSAEDVREAIYQSQYHRWEERYVPKVSSAARVSMIKDSLQHNVLRQDTVEDASKVNANLYRTALQAEGAIQGTQKSLQVNVGSTVINMPEGTTRESLEARLAKLNRLARELNVREVASGEQEDPGGLPPPAEPEPDRTGQPPHEGPQA